MCGGGSTRRPTSQTGSSGSGGTGQVTEEGPEEEDTDTEDPCSFSRRTELDGTNPDVLEDINIGDIYPVELQDERPCVVDFDERVVGSILGSLADLLEDCIEQGHKYQAEIIRIEGRSCEVRVTNKCPINAEAMLASLNPDVLADVSEGDELTVVVREDSLCAVDNSGRIVGSLAEAWTGVLIECVESGWEYRASIEEIDGGNCTVHVTNSFPPE